MIVWMIWLERRFYMLWTVRFDDESGTEDRLRFRLLSGWVKKSSITTLNRLLVRRTFDLLGSELVRWSPTNRKEFPGTIYRL
jgi:hypothetical protein